MNQKLLVVVIVALFASCGDSDLRAFRDRYRWIGGKWESEQDNSRFVEQWVWKKHRYEGQGFEIRGMDTLFREELYLERHGDYDSYVAIIPNQHPILYTAKLTKGGQWKFINTEHDFPGVIGYLPLSDSAIFVELMPSANPAEPQHSYTLKRKK